MTSMYLGPVEDVSCCVEARLLKAAVQHGVDQDEWQDKKEPEDKSDAQHPNKCVLLPLRVVQVAEHHLDPDAHGGVGDDQDGEWKEEEDKVEGLLGVFSFCRVVRANNCAGLRVLLQHHPVHTYNFIASISKLSINATDLPYAWKREGLTFHMLGKVRD